VDNKRRTYLIQDPYDDDAIDFMRSIQMYFGLRPVCLYTDLKERFYGEQQYPILRTDAIEEAVDIGDRSIRSVCDELQDRYDILAVIPYREDTVELAAEICDILKLDWNDRETLLLFRDKFELKRRIVENDPSARVPRYRTIQRLSDVWDGDPLPPRFVIKPNNGLGNQRIGIFDVDERAAIAEHVQSDPPTTWILEEFIEGPEYHVNGQVRSNGEVAVIALFLYTRVSANGYQTVYSGEQQVLTTDPNFDAIVKYAKQVLKNEFGMDQVDFTHYDSERIAISYGISEESNGMIHSLYGIEKIEAMPEFVNWIVKPELGERLGETKELRSAPFIVQMCHHGSKEDSDRLIEFAQQTIRWNVTQERAAMAKVSVKQFVDRGGRKLKWLVSRLC